MGKATSFVLPFIKKEQIAKNTYSFHFDRKGFAFDFIPGQYIRLTLAHNADDRGSSRYFTISSSPKQKEVLTITVRIYDSSFKKALHDLKPGSTVHFFGPMGWFLLPKDEDTEKVFVAGAIGVTPFHSLLHSLVDEKLSKAMTLFASFGKKEEVIFYESFKTITKKNNQIKVVYTLTQEENILNDWDGEVGRISASILGKHITDLQNVVFYIVGSASMVAGTKALLLELGIDEEKIQTEDFTGY